MLRLTQKIKNIEQNEETEKVIDFALKRPYAQKDVIGMDLPQTEDKEVLADMDHVSVDDEWNCVRIGEHFKIAYTSQFPLTSNGGISNFENLGPKHHAGWEIMGEALRREKIKQWR